MNTHVLTAVAACLFATSAVAQSIQECDWVASAANLVEPWSESSRTFANGAIRVAQLDTGGEPACCSNHLLILSPDPDYGQACHVLSDRAGEGFYQLFVSGVETSYDPGKGLLLQVPVGRYESNSLLPIPVRINQATGVVNIEIPVKSGKILKKKAGD